jgi:outer membrane protein assembly factor BamB
MKQHSYFFAVTLLLVFVNPGIRADDVPAKHSLYFPPEQGSWETVQPGKVGWDAAKLKKVLDYAGANQSSGVVILHKGRIIAEQYFDIQRAKSAKYKGRILGRDEAGHAIEDVASAQKSVASILVGIAQQKGLLRIDDPVNKYLATGWSRATPQQENAITIRHLITMTSGLTDRGTFEAEPGTKWRYNTKAYAKSMDVLAAAANMDRHELTRQWLTGPLGMSDSNWVKRRSAEIQQINAYGFATTARDLARFGLMTLAGGTWGNKTILADKQYLKEATTSSQRMNPFYGYLWWVNSDAITPEKALRLGTAPKDMFSANGALNRRCFVVPSLQLVVTRLGDRPDANKDFDRQFWKLLAEALPAEADAYWPGWLGPNRNGWVSDFPPPTRWPEKLKRGWQVEVGTGYGSPLVANGRVYQHARQGNDEVVWCFDLKTGVTKWRKSYAVPFKIGGGGERHGKGPKSSPALADGRVFTMSITGILSAWDADSGKLLWRRDYGARFKKSHPYWGASTSPLIDENRVIVHFGTDGQGVLVALDAESGTEIWSHGKDGPSYSSPLLLKIQGVRQIVEWNQRVLVGVESKSGRFLWEFPFPHIGTDQNMPTPTFHNGRVLLGGENRGIHCLEPLLENGVWTVKERWHQKKVALDMSSAVVNGDLLFGFSHYDSGRLFCLDTKTGEILWQGPARTGRNVMFLSIPGHVVALINDGELKIIAASGDHFETVASYRVAESSTWAPPVLLNNGFLVKDNQTLTLWSLEGSTTRSPARSQ